MGFMPWNVKIPIYRDFTDFTQVYSNFTALQKFYTGFTFWDGLILHSDDKLITISEKMLMCGKVTHKNLIDSSPLFRKNIISKPSRASQRQVNGLSPTVDSPVCPCWWIIKGRQQKVLPPFPIIKERERLHD